MTFAFSVSACCLRERQGKICRWRKPSKVMQGEMLLVTKKILRRCWGWMLKQQIYRQNTKPQNFRIISFTKPNWGTAPSAEKVDCKVSCNGHRNRLCCLSCIGQKNQAGSCQLLEILVCSGWWSLASATKEENCSFEETTVNWKSPISFLLCSGWSPRAVSQGILVAFKPPPKTAEKALAASNL